MRWADLLSAIGEHETRIVAADGRCPTCLGNSARQGVRLGRPSIGIESDPVYFDRALRRLEIEARQGSLFGDAA